MTDFSCLIGKKIVGVSSDERGVRLVLEDEEGKKAVATIFVKDDLESVLGALKMQKKVEDNNKSRL